MKTTRWHSCNVLQIGADARRIWHFGSGRGQIALNAEHRLVAPVPLPPRLIVKSWRALWRKKLNIAWLPTDSVFLRVVHLPKCDPGELRPMVELQLEKLSPLPVNQIVWSLEPVPHSAGELQTAIVVIAGRTTVEQFLGKLEGDGYLADRLELPLLHQLLATEIQGDGLWIFIEPGDLKTVCLAAWWYGGTLQQVNLINLPTGEAGATALGDQLAKIAWAGEIEGWLSAPPRWRLVADDAAAGWEPILRRHTNEPIEIVAPPTPTAVATLTAQRAAQAESKANLLPAEFSARYQQQFIDRLWMRGLGALALVYIAGVLVYLGALQVLKYRTDQAQQQVAGLSGGYTNALQLKERVRILEEQVNLKFAALDYWKIAAELLPPELTLTAFSFSKGGGRVSLRGTAATDDQAKITDYNEAMRKAALNGEPAFAKINPASYQNRGNVTDWSFDCELARAEVP